LFSNKNLFYKLYLFNIALLPKWPRFHEVISMLTGKHGNEAIGTKMQYTVQ
jgi:hypothetical protein